MWNGLKRVHVSMMEIKSEINIWRRMILLIEHAQRESILKFVEFGRPFQIGRQRLKVALDRWLRSIPQIRVV